MSSSSWAGLLRSSKSSSSNWVASEAFLISLIAASVLLRCSRCIVGSWESRRSTFPVPKPCPASSKVPASSSLESRSRSEVGRLFRGGVPGARLPGSWGVGGGLSRGGGVLSRGGGVLSRGGGVLSRAVITVSRLYENAGAVIQPCSSLDDGCVARCSLSRATCLQPDQFTFNFRWVYLSSSPVAALLLHLVAPPFGSS